MGSPEPTEGAPAAPEEAPNEDAKEGEKPSPEEGTETGEPKEGGEEGEAEAKEEGEAEEGEEKGEEAEEGEKHKRAGGWRRKIERLERQIEHLQTQRPGAAAPPQKPESEKTPNEKATEAFDRMLDQRLEAREQQRQQESAVAEFRRRAGEEQAKHEDFDDVVSYVNIPAESALGQAILTSEHGPAIMYQLAKNPAELARISALPPIVAAREIGRLEAKLPSSTASPKTAKSALRPPAPPTSVNGTPSKTRNLDDLPLSEYKRAMRSGRR